MPITTPVAERFHLSYMPEPNSGCWLWLGATRRRGYGNICIDGLYVAAHRFSWELHKGPIPFGMFVCHRCDTPACVNPDHLWLGTRQQNVDDMIAKGRQTNMVHANAAVRGEAHYRAKLTLDAVLEIRGFPRLPTKELAARFGVSRRTINNARCGVVWKHVPPIQKATP